MNYKTSNQHKNVYFQIQLNRETQKQRVTLTHSDEHKVEKKSCRTAPKSRDTDPKRMEQSQIPWNRAKWHEARQERKTQVLEVPKRVTEHALPILYPNRLLLLRERDPSAEMCPLSHEIEGNVGVLGCYDEMKKKFVGLVEEKKRWREVGF